MNIPSDTFSENLRGTTKSLIRFQLEDVPFFSKRNASIALMSLLVDLHEDRKIFQQLKAIDPEMESLFSACLKHYQLFGHHICCFDDIRNPVCKLSVSERESYIQEVKLLCKKRSFGLLLEVSYFIIYHQVIIFSHSAREIRENGLSWRQII